MDAQVYVVTVAGELDPVLRHEFEDFEVHVARGVTRIHFTSGDASVLHGVLRRVEALGLELLDVHPSAPTRPS